MEPGIATELGVAAATMLAGVVIGWRLQRGLGAVLLALGTFLASFLVIGGTLLGRTWKGDQGAWLGLALGCLVTALLAWPITNKIVRGRSGRFVAWIWVAYCAFCVLGYLAGGWIGLLTITLPAVIIFWAGVYRIAAHVLPLPDRHRNPKAFRVVRSQAFRAMLTAAMGTNYPYYLVRDGKVQAQVDGNAYNQFFAGPGLAYLDCDQAAYLTDGVRVRGVQQPGLNFTGMFDRAPKAIDLRPQLCSFPVEAVTQDGIPVKGKAFAAFRIPPAKDPPEPMRPFAFRHRSIYQIAAQEPAGRPPTEEAAGDRFEWTTDLVPQIATRILQDVISHYGVDDLCAAFEPRRLPCREIADRLNSALHHPLGQAGIELVEAWIGELKPVDDSITKRRIDNWKTEWERQIVSLMNEGRAEYGRKIEQARADAELKILLRFGQVAQASHLGDVASQTALALRFIDCLGEIVSDTESQWPLPEGTRETLQQLRGEIQEGQR